MVRYTFGSLSARRAWIEIAGFIVKPGTIWSLSARRAWIEISVYKRKIDSCWVALRKESVDRNICVMHIMHNSRLSLSARRAWIEITFSGQTESRQSPSLSARRAWIEISLGCTSKTCHLVSLSARRAWIEIHSGFLFRLNVQGRSPQGERG